jgi:hypothetical protein
LIQTLTFASPLVTTSRTEPAIAEIAAAILDANKDEALDCPAQ